MQSIAVLVLSLLIVGVLCHPAKVIHDDPNVEVGMPCTPKDAEHCGECELLMETYVPAVDGYG